MDKILIKRGTKEKLDKSSPLSQGELFLAKDEERLYVGGPKGNIPIATQKEVDEKHQKVTTQLDQIEKEVDEKHQEVTTQLAQIAVNVKSFGAKGDGISDDTSAIQNAIDYVSNLGGGRVLIPKGVYMIKGWDDRYKTGTQIHNANYDYQGGIILKDNVILEGSGKGVTVLKEIATDSDSYNVIRVREVNNVSIMNMTIVGDRDTHLGTTGEHGHGISILQSQKVNLFNVEIKNTWGDGIFLGVLKYNTSDRQTNEIVFRDVKIDSARRNALSLCSCDGLFIDNLIIENVEGVPPSAGIDIEPEGWGTTSPVLKNININNLKIKNARYGVAIYPTGYTSRIDNVHINNFHSEGGAVAIVCKSVTEKPISGNIVFNNVVIERSGWTAIVCNDYLSTHPRLTFNKIRIVDPNNTHKNTNDNARGYMDGSGVAIYREDSSTYTTPIGNIEFNELEVIDTRDPLLTNVAFYCRDHTGVKPKDVKLVNPKRLDALRVRQMQNVEVVDPYYTLESNLSYFEDIWNNSYPRTLIKSSGTAGRRYVTISDDVTENNEVLLINDGENGITIDLDKTTPRLRIYPFENTKRYLRTLTEGSTLKIKKIGGKLIAIQQTGKWENSENP